jgi:hypothetical protein
VSGQLPNATYINIFEQRYHLATPFIVSFLFCCQIFLCCHFSLLQVRNIRSPKKLHAGAGGKWVQSALLHRHCSYSSYQATCDNLDIRVDSCGRECESGLKEVICTFCTVLPSSVLWSFVKPSKSQISAFHRKKERADEIPGKLWPGAVGSCFRPASLGHDLRYSNL